MSSPVSSWISLPHRLRHPVGPNEAQTHQVMCELRVALVGIIQSFDAQKQTVTVQPTIREKMNIPTPDGQGNTVPVITDVQLPVLIDVPICPYHAGNMSITVPIQPGDECLVIMTDTCFNAWWANGGIQSQEEGRRHDLSDAIAILGPNSVPNAIPNYSPDTLQIRSKDGLTVIDVDPNSSVVKLTAASVIVTGNLVVQGTTELQGTATVDGDPMINSRDFMAHEHTGGTIAGHTGGVI